jgi:hypothetical protein
MNRREFLFTWAAVPDLWELARSKRKVHQFSTLFTAQDVRDRLAGDAGLASAVDWCRKTAVTKVYIESFRDGYQAERAALLGARERFLREGFEVAGCITPTQVGKPTTGWKPLSCYTDHPTQARIRSIFEYAAGFFDEIMIDDFWFTDCTCSECDRARRAQRVDIAGMMFDAAGQTWEDYRRELMYQLSRLYMMEAARQVNRRARLILKYPQWYDRFHERGYDVVRETELFDRIWVGTETRDRDKGGAMPYEAYFIMRWLGGIGGKKTGGGWYDPYQTSEATYLEQARQTVLAGARESMLFCYGALQRQTGPANVEALRREIPELVRVAEEVRKREERRPAIGIAAFKPPNSPPGKDAYVFDAVGMLGLPLVPCHQFPVESAAAFFSFHALKDPGFLPNYALYVASGKPLLITDGLAESLTPELVKAPNVRVLPVRGAPKTLVDLPPAELDAIRAHMLRPFETTLKGPNELGLYLFKDRSWVVENFGGRAAALELNGEKIEVPARGWTHRWR